MNTTKKLLALLLACALAFCAAVPAFAEGAAPVITQQPPKAVTVLVGQSFTLNITAQPGAAGEIKYQWYKDGAAIPGATADTLTQTPFAALTDWKTIAFSATSVYKVKISCSQADGTLTESVWSDECKVTTGLTVAQCYQLITLSKEFNETLVNEMKISLIGTLGFWWLYLAIIAPFSGLVSQMQAGKK